MTSALFACGNFYLASSEMSFREQNLMVFQIQLTKRQDVVPMTRDYIMQEEQRLRETESARRAPLRHWPASKPVR